MSEDVRLKELISSLKNDHCDLDSVVNQCLDYVREGGGGEKAHSYLCATLLDRECVGGSTCSHLLNCLGPTPAILAAHSNIPRVKYVLLLFLSPKSPYLPLNRVSSVRWLARELEIILESKSLSLILYRETSSSSSSLSPEQEQLLSAITKLPDKLANRLGHSLPLSLLPTSIFSSLGSSLIMCLSSLHSDLRGSLLLFLSLLVQVFWLSAGGTDRCLVFLASLVSKVSLLGHSSNTFLWNWLHI